MGQREQFFSRLGENMVLKKIKDNWKAGLTVALISIPLSISLAVASGTTPTVGIITAVWAGLIASLFGGSNFNVIGPTGALAGIIATFAFANGPQALPMLTILTGLFILAAYTLKLERYLILIPSSVIHGFTLGVAFIIGLNQLNYAFGLKNVPQHDHFFANVLESFKHLPNLSLITFAIFLAFFGGLLLLRFLLPRVPGAIVLAPVGIALGYMGNGQLIPFRLETLGDKFTDLSFKLFQAPSITFSAHILQTAATVALIAILETMLSAKIADGMTHTKHNPRKEMFGLGLANLICGFFGGIPATAALARTSLNIKTQANDKMAATINAIFIALISIFLLPFFKFIPLAVIAAILVYVSVQMVEAEHFITFYKYERPYFFVSMAVAMVTIYKDPIIGILLGATVSLMLLVDKIAQGHYDIKLRKRRDDSNATIAGEQTKEIAHTDVLLYSMKGKLCYINGRAHITRFENIFRKYRYVILRLREIYFIDLDGVAALNEIIEIGHARGQTIVITSVSPSTVEILEKASSSYQKLKRDNLVFKTTHDALDYFSKLNIH